ncbi:hypothetical protein D3C86_2086960 [compost metagenome]
MITAKVIAPKVTVSVLKVPADSGIYLFSAKRPAMATGPIMGRNRLKSKINPVLIFHQILLSARPSNPEPLLAFAEVYSYSISENP